MKVIPEDSIEKSCLKRSENSRRRGGKKMDAYNTINDILVHLFNEIWELEKKAIITEEFKDITNNDMHIIEAIGVSGKTTMSVVAKKMKITAGSLTTAVNGLVNKKYVMCEVMLTGG